MKGATGLIGITLKCVFPPNVKSHLGFVLSRWLIVRFDNHVVAALNFFYLKIKVTKEKTRLDILDDNHDNSAFYSRWHGKNQAKLKLVLYHTVIPKHPFCILF